VAFQVPHRWQGKLLSIGIYPDVTLAQARVARDAARALLASDEDPGEAKQERKRLDGERRGLTFESKARAFAAKTEKEGKAEATMAKTDWLLSMAISDFGKKRLCCANATKDSLCESSVVAGLYEPVEAPDLPHHELA
jgi:hypothetical protein